MNRFIFSFLLVAFFSLERAEAQSIWSQRTGTPELKLEYLSPTFALSFPGFEISSQILTLDARYPIGEFAVVLAEAPMSWETETTPFRSTSKNGIGNVLVGVELGRMDSPVYGELIARPFLRQDLSSSGALAYIGDFDRGEAYLEELTSFQLALNVVSTQTGKFAYRVRFGPSVWVPEKGETMTLIDYGAKAGYDDGAFSLYTALTGRWNTKATSGKSAFHHAGFELGYRFGRIRPTLFLRAPLDKEISDAVSNTKGVGVSVDF